MRTIHKFQLSITNRRYVRMPSAAKILTVQTQDGEPMIWVDLDTDDEYVNRTVFVYGTGHAVSPDANRYIGTFQSMGDRLVFHVYEKSA